MPTLHWLAHTNYGMRVTKLYPKSTYFYTIDGGSPQVGIETTAPPQQSLLTGLQMSQSYSFISQISKLYVNEKYYIKPYIFFFKIKQNRDADILVKDGQVKL